MQRACAKHVAGHRVRSVHDERRRVDAGSYNHGRLRKGVQVRMDGRHGRTDVTANDELGAATQSEDDQNDHRHQRRQRRSDRRVVRRPVVALFVRRRRRHCRSQCRPRADGVRGGDVAVLRVGGVQACYLPVLQLKLPPRLSRGVLYVNDEVLSQQHVHDHDDVGAGQAQPHRHGGR